MKNVLVLLILLLPSASLADDIRFTPTVTVTAAVTLIADANGVLQLDRSKPILIGSIGTLPTDPTDPVDPTDPTDPTDPLEQKVLIMVGQAPTPVNERKTVAELFRMTGQLPLTDPKDIRQATTILFDVLPMSAAWKTWKVGVDSFAAGLGIADVKRAWKMIGEGLLK